MSELYAENILYHYQNPSNKGELPDAEVQVGDVNTLCGDKVKLYVKLNGGVIEKLMFQGSGCAISMASASMLTEHVHGKTIKEVASMGQQDVLTMMGLPSLTPMRIKCAMLPLRTLQKGLITYESKHV